MITTLTVIDTRHRPADDQAIRQWLTRLACAVSNPPNEEDMAARLSAIMFVCGEFPAGCWTDDTLRSAIRKFRFWPAAAEVHDLLKPRADVLAETLRLTHTPRAQESTKPYNPVASPEVRPPARYGRPIDDTAWDDDEKPRTPIGAIGKLIVLRPRENDSNADP